MHAVRRNIRLQTRLLKKRNAVFTSQQQIAPHQSISAVAKEFRIVLARWRDSADLHFQKCGIVHIAAEPQHHAVKPQTFRGHHRVRDPLSQLRTRHLVLHGFDIVIRRICKLGPSIDRQQWIRIFKELKIVRQALNLWY